MIKSLTIIFSLLFAGNALSALLGIPVPGSIIGMLLMTLSLHFKWIDVESVKPASDLLNKEMAFFFIPPGVGLMLYLDVIKNEWMAILLSCVLSTFMIMFVVAYSYKWLKSDES
ncbi:CidA/LrgA family protein [Aureibacter tunicatorum]|uniref:Holin-like protein n=1 Tax=Aureibacter tunicatorum TaxID=866807 RepID=A0AAE3XIQ7_9BACT|nr:CidA/LrgA family protein [Aureibacter tunicatorum]MDR6237142.1 holin-like protein [Aureibacter tunicatorum]BDD06134.1 hypothetical protein AUTU_36170 [Aureibacter tunicatorum]